MKCDDAQAETIWMNFLWYNSILSIISLPHYTALKSLTESTMHNEQFRWLLQKWKKTDFLSSSRKHPARWSLCEANNKTHDKSALVKNSITPKLQNECNTGTIPHIDNPSHGIAGFRHLLKTSFTQNVYFQSINICNVQYHWHGTTTTTTTNTTIL